MKALLLFFTPIFYIAIRNKNIKELLKNINSNNLFYFFIFYCYFNLNYLFKYINFNFE